ncbi:MAG: fumarylacetoacetate hydrolase family protein [Pirellulales bacterium]
MKWLTYNTPGGVKSGVLDDAGVHEYSGPESLLELIGTGNDGLSAAGEEALRQPGVDVTSLEIVAPFQPPSMRDSMCFHEHIRNCNLGAEFDERHRQFPAFYFSNPAATIGPFDDAHIGPGSQMFDYELEVAAVIGKRGSNIRAEDAQEYIIGYTMYIDWSSRDVQFNEMQMLLGPAKGKDTATTLGPTLVTKDEFEPLRKNKGFDIAMRASINGRQISEGNWSTIDWTFDDVIAYTSRGTTLVPGDILGSGTVGRGCLYEHYRLDPSEFHGWLKPGDIVEMHIDLIGDTRQTVVAAAPRHPLSSGW